MDILELRNVTKDFGGLRAINDVSFGAREGQIKAIIGPNGSGKTTLINLITGVFRQTSGLIYFRKKLIGGLKPHRISSLGIARTWQDLKIFGDMTAVENVMVGRHLKSRAGFLSCGINLPSVSKMEKEDFEKSMMVLEFLGLERFAAQKAKNLSYGNQKILEIGRALGTEPSLLLLDEPAAGLNPSESRNLSKTIEKMREGNLTIVLVEHVMELVMRVSDEVVVMNNGEKLVESLYSEIKNNPAVIKAYLGEEIDYARRKKH